MTNRTVTLPTSDHGPVTMPEPAWCAGHADHRPDSLRADLLHLGPDVRLTFRGRLLIDAGLVQSPYGIAPAPGISVHEVGPLNPREVYELAAALDSYADRLRDLADQLAAILAGGGGQ